MQVRVLGELAVEVNGAPADLGGPEPRALLALLVTAEGRPVSVSHLVERIWGEQPPARVEASLQSYVARLRRQLEPAMRARATDDRLRTNPGGYSLALTAEQVDARRFTELIRRARSDGAAVPTRAGALLAETSALWQGDLIGMRGGATRLRLPRPRGTVAADPASWPHRMRADRTTRRGPEHCRRPSAATA